jgi:hypothetical protein
MDTIIVNNQIIPVKIDSLHVNSDFSIIVDHLDSIKIQNKKGFQQLSQTIETNTLQSKFKSVSKDAIFSTITTILIFSLGILINLIIKKIEKGRSKKSIRSYAKLHLDRIVDPLTNKLQEGYTKIANETSIDTGIMLTPPTIMSNDFYRFLQIDTKALFESIKKKKELSNIVSQIDYISNLISEVKFYHSNALTRSNEIRERLNTSFNKYMDSLVNCLLYEKKTTSDYEKKEPYKTINNSIVKFYEEYSGKRELQKFFDEILIPNQGFWVNGKYLETHPNGSDVGESGKDLAHLINDLKILTNEFKEQYAEFSESIKKSSISLNENLGKISW